MAYRHCTSLAKVNGRRTNCIRLYKASQNDEHFRFGILLRTGIGALDPCWYFGYRKDLYHMVREQPSLV